MNRVVVIITDSKKLKNKGIQHKPRTPAQKLGIANKSYKISDILKFSSVREVIHKMKVVS